jgi:hypothetical protein
VYATWVVRRSQVQQQAIQYGTPAFIAVGTWIGSFQPLQDVLTQFPGAPSVLANALAILPVDAGSVVMVGDVFYFAEKSVGYTAQDIMTFTEKCLVYLKTIETQSGT